MPLDIKLINPFERAHEKAMWESFEKSLKEQYKENGEQIIVLGNFQCERQLDAFVIKSKGIGIIDFKAYSGEINAYQNDPWRANGEAIKSSGGNNPFFQVQSAKQFVADRMAARFSKADYKNGAPNWMYTRGWVVFNSPSKFNNLLDNNVRKWFGIDDINSIAKAVLGFETPSYHLATEECYQIKDIVLGRAQTTPKKSVKLIKSDDFQSSLRELITHQGEAQTARRMFQSYHDQMKIGREPLKDVPYEELTQVHSLRAYKVTPNYRLLSIFFHGNHYLVFMGTCAQALDWADRNVGLTLVIDPQSQKIRPVPTGISAALVNAKTTVENKPLLDRIQKFIEKLGFDKLKHQILWSLNEDSKDEDIESAVLSLPGEMLQSALRDALHLLKGDHIEAATDRLNLYLGEFMTLENAPELESKSLEGPQNSEVMIDLNDLDELEMERYLQAVKEDQWMYYLHPGQRRVVDEDFSGPVVLTGVSGSGKTSVLLHRAKRLSTLYPDQKILVLAFNNHLAAVLKRLLKGLCTQDNVFQRITVVSFHEYLSDLLAAGFDLAEILQFLGDNTHLAEQLEKLMKSMSPSDYESLLYPLEINELSEFFKDYLGGLEGTDRDTFNNLEIFLTSQNPKIDASDYIREEIDLVRGAFPDANYSTAYLSGFPRHGRAIPFQQSRKQQILDLLQGWEKFQVQNQFLDFMALAQLAYFAIQKHGSIPVAHRYRCVLVDEFQDFSSFELRLLAGIPTNKENGLFLTGDFAQKLYAKQLSLADAGLDVAKTHRRSIRKNYRNTRQILDAAHELLKAYPIPQYGDTEGLVILDPELAANEASKPTAYRAADPLTAAWSDVVECINGGFASHSICIISANEDLYPIEDIVAAKPDGVDAQRLSSWADSDARSIAVSDIASVKGFEFRLVLIIGLDEGVFPPVGRYPGEVWRDALRLYIAMTRGMMEVRFYFEGQPSEMLAKMGGKIAITEWTGSVPPAESPLQIESADTPSEPIAPPISGVQAAEPPSDEKPLSELLPDPAMEFSRTPVALSAKDADDQSWLLTQRQRLLELKEAVLCRLAGEDIEGKDAYGESKFDRDFANAFLSQLSPHYALREINAALKKIDQGNYGVCEISGEKIPRSRLEALPCARYTAERQAEIDRKSLESGQQKNMASLSPAVAVEPPPVATPVESENTPTKFHKTVVAGYRTIVFASLPSQLDIAAATGATTAHIANFLFTRHNLTIVPNSPLPKHLVEKICESLDFVAEFRTAPIQAPAEPARPELVPKPQNVAPQISPEIQLREIDSDGLHLGEITILPGGEVFHAVKPRNDREMEACQIRPYRLSGPEGLELVLHDIVFASEERLVTCGENLTLLPKWQRIVHRLKMGAKRLEDGTWMMELRQAQTNDRGWATRSSVSLGELHAGSGIDVGSLLTELGALGVGTRRELYGETNRRQNQLAVRFGQPNKVVPVAAYVLATIHPMLRDYPGLV